jgi:uncharacterized membrane protein
VNRTRLEAFSDGVLAIIITIMVLELRTPAEGTWSALAAVLPTFLSYLLSFVYVGIYWSNHHHLMHLVDRVDGAVLWANLHLLFWLSLIPFTTRWINESEFAQVPVVVYGVNLMLAAVAYAILQWRLVRVQGTNGSLRAALGQDWKGKLSPLIYLVGIGLTFVQPLLGVAVYTVVALLWLVPDRRVERYLTTASDSGEPAPGP